MKNVTLVSNKYMLKATHNDYLFLKVNKQMLNKVECFT